MKQIILQLSHPYDINRLDGNISCDVHCTHSLKRNTVFEVVELVPIYFNLRGKHVRY